MPQSSTRVRPAALPGLRCWNSITRLFSGLSNPKHSTQRPRPWSADADLTWLMGNGKGRADTGTCRAERPRRRRYAPGSHPVWTCHSATRRATTMMWSRGPRCRTVLRCPRDPGTAGPRARAHGRWRLRSGYRGHRLSGGTSTRLDRGLDRCPLRREYTCDIPQRQPTRHAGERDHGPCACAHAEPAACADNRATLLLRCPCRGRRRSGIPTTTRTVAARQEPVSPAKSFTSISIWMSWIRQTSYLPIASRADLRWLKPSRWSNGWPQPTILSD